MKKFTIALILAPALFLLFLASSSPASTERRVALVIGNGAYAASPLRNPVNDATDMAALLRGLGFEVILRTDADRRGMVEAIDAFGRKLPQSDIGLLYYAGHGVQIRDRNYLIPVRAQVTSETDVELESVDVFRILGRMEEAGTPANIIILDACRDNPFERSFRTSSRGLARMDAPAGSIIAFATAPGGVAADGTGRNGLFTRHLLQNLARPGIGLTQALMVTRRAVAEETGRQQVPWDSSSLMSEVYFTPPTTAALTTTPPPAQPPVAPPVTPPITTQQPVQQPPQQVAMAPKPPSPTGPRAGEAWKEPQTGMEFVWVPGGCFQMGCGSWTDQCYNDEKPLREICLDAFWIGRYEVTQGQWQRVKGLPSSQIRDGDKYPVVNVSWNDVQDFIGMLNSSIGGPLVRLPTEAEWEYACRGGGRKEKFCGGDDVNGLAWFNDNRSNTIHPVGLKAPNALGIFDMSGNVFEWVHDIYDSGAYSRSGGGNNPVVETGGSGRVIRGGGWFDGPEFLRAASRRGVSPNQPGSNLGFRLAMTVPN